MFFFRILFQLLLRLIVPLPTKPISKNLRYINNFVKILLDKNYPVRKLNFMSILRTY